MPSLKLPSNLNVSPKKLLGAEEFKKEIELVLQTSVKKGDLNNRKFLALNKVFENNLTDEGMKAAIDYFKDLLSTDSLIRTAPSDDFFQAIADREISSSVFTYLINNIFIQDTGDIFLKNFGSSSEKRREFIYKLFSKNQLDPVVTAQITNSFLNPGFGGRNKKENLQQAILFNIEFSKDLDTLNKRRLLFGGGYFTNSEILSSIIKDYSNGSGNSVGRKFGIIFENLPFVNGTNSLANILSIEDRIKIVDTVYSEQLKHGTIVHNDIALICSYLFTYEELNSKDKKLQSFYDMYKKGVYSNFQSDSTFININITLLNNSDSVQLLQDIIQLKYETSNYRSRNYLDDGFFTLLLDTVSNRIISDKSSDVHLLKQKLNKIIKTFIAKRDKLNFPDGLLKYMDLQSNESENTPNSLNIDKDFIKMSLSRDYTVGSLYSRYGKEQRNSYDNMPDSFNKLILEKHIDLLKTDQKTSYFDDGAKIKLQLFDILPNIFKDAKDEMMEVKISGKFEKDIFVEFFLQGRKGITKDDIENYLKERILYISRNKYDGQSDSILINITVIQDLINAGVSKEIFKNDTLRNIHISRRSILAFQSLVEPEVITNVSVDSEKINNIAVPNDKIEKVAFESSILPKDHIFTYLKNISDFLKTEKLTSRDKEDIDSFIELIKSGTGPFDEFITGSKQYWRRVLKYPLFYACFLEICSHSASIEYHNQYHNREDLKNKNESVENKNVNSLINSAMKTINKDGKSTILSGVRFGLQNSSEIMKHYIGSKITVGNSKLSKDKSIAQLIAFNLGNIGNLDIPIGMFDLSDLQEEKYTNFNIYSYLSSISNGDFKNIIYTSAEFVEIFKNTKTGAIDMTLLDKFIIDAPNIFWQERPEILNEFIRELNRNIDSGLLQISIAKNIILKKILKLLSHIPNNSLRPERNYLEIADELADFSKNKDLKRSTNTVFSEMRRLNYGNGIDFDEVVKLLKKMKSEFIPFEDIFHNEYKLPGVSRLSSQESIGLRSTEVFKIYFETLKNEVTVTPNIDSIRIINEFNGKVDDSITEIFSDLINSKTSNEKLPDALHSGKTLEVIGDIIKSAPEYPLGEKLKGSEGIKDYNLETVSSHILNLQNYFINLHTDKNNTLSNSDFFGFLKKMDVSARTKIITSIFDDMRLQELSKDQNSMISIIKQFDATISSNSKSIGVKYIGTLNRLPDQIPDFVSTDSMTDSYEKFVKYVSLISYYLEPSTARVSIDRPDITQLRYLGISAFLTEIILRNDIQPNEKIDIVIRNFVIPYFISMKLSKTDNENTKEKELFILSTLQDLQNKYLNKNTFSKDIRDIISKGSFTGPEKLMILQNF